MRHEGSLRGRIVAAYGLLAVAICGLFSFVVFFTVQEVEAYLVQKRLASIAEWQLTRQNKGDSTELPPGISMFTGTDIPPAMRSLSPGFHELPKDLRTLHVLVGVAQNGEPFAAVDEISDFERIEREIVAGLGFGVLISTLLAVLLGRLTAGKVIVPVTALAEAVKRDGLDERAPSLALDDEIGVLARAFAAKSAELRRFLMRERLFTGDVSHELRTPLAVIQGAAEVLTARLGHDPQLLAAAERIFRTATDTADRVGALLLLSRSPEALGAPRVALLPLIEREVERFRPLLAGKPVALVVKSDGEVWVFAHPELAATAVGNLLRNACDYTEEGEVAVHLSHGSLVVEDTGPGLPKPARDQLFEPFLPVGEDHAASAGRGLAIVKRVAEHLDWNIRFEDRPGGGSRFIFSFPSS